jgi:hypothetical protein
MSEKELCKGSHTSMNQEVAFEITADMKHMPKCLCDNSCCSRHSNCRACVQFHTLTNHPPQCKRGQWKWEDPKDVK